MTDILSIGATGIRAYQRALSTVSNNIANAENPDYVRRDLRLGEFAVTTGFTPLQTYQLYFGGVEINGVARATDPFLEANVRLTGASLYGAETRAKWMESIETALGDNDNGVGANLNRTFASAEQLAGAPFDNVLRQQFLADIEATVTATNRTASNLSQISDQLAGSTGQELASFNEALENLAEINLGLRTAVDGSTKQAALLDQRDTALAVLSERMDVTIEFTDKGVANISYAGEALVNETDFNPVTLNVAPDGTLALEANGNALPAPSQGSLSSLISSAAITAQRRSDLDGFATQFANDVNTFQANGRTDAGAAGAALLDAAGGAAGLALLSSDPAALALAAPGGSPNGNIINFGALRGPAGFDQAWTNTVGAQAILTASAQSESAAAAAQHEAAREARDNLSSVDLDREAADLIRFQQAYDASARVIQVARETMQSVLAIF